MAISNRYDPPHPPGETCNFALDFSPVIPLGVGIQSANLTILLNTNPPQSQDDWTLADPQIIGRRLYVQCGGGVEGTDYQFVWTATDSLGNVWPRTTLVLCASAS